MSSEGSHPRSTNAGGMHGDRQERSQWMTVAIANLCHPSAEMGKQGGENLKALLGGIFRGPLLTVKVEVDMRRYLRTDGFFAIESQERCKGI